MEHSEVLEIGRQLRLKRLIRPLFEEVKLIRPSLNIDTVYRAFNHPHCSTELLNVIREAGKNMIQGKMVEAA